MYFCSGLQKSVQLEHISVSKRFLKESGYLDIYLFSFILLLHKYADQAQGHIVLKSIAYGAIP